MSPTSEGPATMKWHDATESLSTDAGEAEAQAYLRKYANTGGTAVAIEYDESGEFRSTGGARELIARLDAADSDWATAAPFHVEVDAMRGQLPPIKPKES